jgi:hypothetical protein
VPSDHDLLSPTKLVEALEGYLARYPTAALLEDGRVLFDMRLAHYSIMEAHGRCVLQLWSEERNMVRTVLEIQHRAQSLRVLTRKMGAPKPQALELVPNSDRRTPTARDSARRNYQRLLERVLTRAFLGAKVDGFRSDMDLEHSFGPAYVRGRLLRGTAADAVIGIGPLESSAAIDGILTLGILSRLLPSEERCATALRRVEGRCPRRSLANDCRAHGLDEPFRGRVSALCPG